MLRSPRKRKWAFWSLLVLGVAYVAWTLADEFFATGSFRSKAIAFLVFFIFGCGTPLVYRLSQRRQDRASSRPRR